MPGCMSSMYTLHNRVIMLGLTVRNVCDGVKAVKRVKALGCRKMGWEIGMDGQERMVVDDGDWTGGSARSKPCVVLACDVCWQTRPHPCRESLGRLQACAVLFRWTRTVYLK
jgi:hypothetical protein